MQGAEAGTGVAGVGDGHEFWVGSQRDFVFTLVTWEVVRRF